MLINCVWARGRRRVSMWSTIAVCRQSASRAYASNQGIRLTGTEAATQGLTVEVRIHPLRGDRFPHSMPITWWPCPEPPQTRRHLAEASTCKARVWRGTRSRPVPG